MAEFADDMLLDEELLAWKHFNAVPPVRNPAADLSAALRDVVRLHGNEKAVIAPDGELTYDELYRRATDCARGLVGRGVRPGDRVGLVARRSADCYVLICAAVLVGAAYVPVGRQQSAESNIGVLRRAEIGLLVAAGAEDLDEYRRARDVTCLTVRQLSRGRDGGPADAEFDECDDLLPAYVIHTSGTTGTPKGVVVARHSILNLAQWYIERHEVSRGDRLTQNAPLTFDPSAQQIFAAWLSGACLHVVPEEVRVDPAEFTAWLAASRITHLDMVTAHWTSLCVALENGGVRLPALRWAIVAGEAMYLAQCERWFSALGPGCRLQNIYGPTEATVNATEFEVRPGELDSLRARSPKVPIGVPLPGYRVYLLDGTGELCPPGTSGEIVIAGAGVAAGYLHDPGRTAERFGEIALRDTPAARVYRSGDLAELVDLGDGRWVLDFRGRRDRQIKLSGYRVELGAVEQAAEGCPGVDHVVVLPQGSPAERLACVYSGTAGTEALRSHLRASLPSYVLVSEVLRVDSLPVTETGKVDMKAVGALVERSAAGAGRDDEQPAGTVERLIAEVWGSELQRPAVRGHDRFFDVGGSSLAAFRIVVRLRKNGLDVRGMDILGNLSVAECARLAASREPVSAAGSGGGTASGPDSGPPPVVWTDDLDALRSALATVWRSRTPAVAGVAEVGPLTRAWLSRPRTSAPTACVEIEFEPGLSLDTVATALAGTIDAHAALRTRWSPAGGSVGGPRTAEFLAEGIPVARLTLPSDDPARLVALRGLVAEAAAAGGGQAHAAVAAGPSGTMNALLFVPHVLVDGHALEIITAELADRARGIVPVPVREPEPVIKRWNRDVADRHDRGVTRTAADVWSRFRAADALLSGLASRDADAGCLVQLGLGTPEIPYEARLAWLCAVAARAVGSAFGMAVVPVSVLRPASSDRALRPIRGIAANMLDAVPLLVDVSEGGESAARTALDGAARVEHWAGLAMLPGCDEAARWSHSGSPLIGGVIVQQAAEPLAMADGVRTRLPGPMAQSAEFWVELTQQILTGEVRVSFGGLGARTAERLTAGLRRAAVCAAPADGGGA